MKIALSKLKNKAQAELNFSDLKIKSRQKFSGPGFFGINKKSQATTEALFVLSEILLVVAAIFLIFGKITSVDNDQLFLKKYYSRDLAVLIDQIQGMGGNLLYLYNPAQTTLSKLDFKFKKTHVEAGNDKYPVAAKEIQEIEIQKPKSLRITKQNNKIEVKENREASQQAFNFNKINCPEIKTNVQNLAIDPGHGYNKETELGDTGFKIEQKQESMLMANLAASLQSALRVLNINSETTRNTLTSPTEESKTIEERKNFVQNAGTIISLHANKENPENNNIKAYVNFNSQNYLESYKLACEILNSISDNFVLETTGTAIIPTDLNQLDEEDPKQILLDKKFAVYLEVGNIGAKNSFIENYAKLAPAIASGIAKYNE